jgi:hypothetical protein
MYSAAGGHLASGRTRGGRCVRRRGPPRTSPCGPSRRLEHPGPVPRNQGGPQAIDVVDHLITNTVRDTELGGIRHGLLCDDAAPILKDAGVFVLARIGRE